MQFEAKYMPKKKFTPLKTFILGVFVTYDKEMSGYDLIKVAKEWRYDHYIESTKSSFYYTLGKLDKENLIRQVRYKQEGNRPEQSVYKLTSQGKKEFFTQMTHYLNEIQDFYFNLDCVTPFVLIFGFLKDKKFLLNSIKTQIETRENLKVKITDGKRLVQSHELFDVNPFMILALEHFKLHNNAELAWLKQFYKMVDKTDFQQNIREIMARTRS